MNRIKVSIYGLKDEDNLEKLVEILETLGVNVSDFFRSMNRGSTFSFYTEPSNYESVKERLDELCFHSMEAYSKDIVSSSGFTSLALLDTLLVFFVSSWFVNNLKVQELVSNLFLNPTLAWSLTELVRILLAFLIYLGFLENLETTPIGHLFKLQLKSSGKVRVFTAFMLLPVLGLVLINSPFGHLAKLFGLFLFVFFVVASMSDVLTSTYGVRFEKSR
ncbi:MAG: hypothetical protein ACK4SM_02220 [Aquificaceae bacterium]